MRRARPDRAYDRLVRRAPHSTRTDEAAEHPPALGPTPPTHHTVSGALRIPLHRHAPGEAPPYAELMPALGVKLRIPTARRALVPRARLTDQLDQAHTGA